MTNRLFLLRDTARGFDIWIPFVSTLFTNLLAVSERLYSFCSSVRDFAFGFFRFTFARTLAIVYSFYCQA